MTTATRHPRDAAPAASPARATADGPFRLGRRTRLPGHPSVSRGTAVSVLGLLMLVGLAIRAAIPRGLWLDEAISLHQAHLGLPELIQNLSQTDRHPPLHHAVLWVVTRVVGDGDLEVRGPSIVGGVLLIAAVYWLAVEVFDRRTGLVAALLTTLAPTLVWYSQEARGYALEALFCTLAVLGCVRVIKRGRGSDWALHTVAAALAIWTHWFAIFIVLATEAILLWELLRRRRARQPMRRFAVGWGIAVLLVCAIAPVIALLGLGLHSPDVIDVRYFVAALPLALVLFARLALSWPNRSGARALAVVVMAAVLAGALVDQQLNDRNPRRDDFRQAPEGAEQRMGPDGVLLYQPSELRYVIERYSPELYARPLGNAPPTPAQARRVVVLASFLDQDRYRSATDRVVGALHATRRDGPRDRFAGVRLWSFR